MSFIKIHNVETGEIIERPMNDEELAQWEADKLAGQLELEAATERAAAKTALLEKLGITESEAKLLLS
jgi:hypothetical protein